MSRVNTDVLENYKDDTDMFQNLLSNKCTEVEVCHKTDVLNDFEKSLEFDESNKDTKLNYLLMLNPDNFNVGKNRLLNLM